MDKKNKKLIILLLGLFFVFSIFATAKAAFNFTKLDEQARTKYLEAKQNYLNATSTYQDARTAYQQALSRFKNASEEQKSKLQEQVLEKAKEYLKKTISTMIKYLEAMKNKTTNMRPVSDEDKAVIAAKINENIRWLNAKQAEINSASTIDKLKEISQAVNEKLNNIRIASKSITGQMLVARIKFLIDKSQAIADKLEAKINELKTAGKDVAKLDELLKDFKDKIALAKDKYEQAKAKFQAISSKDNAVQLFQEGHKLVNDANQYVKQAHQDLVQIVRRIKQLEQPNSGNDTTTPKNSSGNEPG
ncbi:MAG: hypothetical protein AUJ32_03120 [Parcubacteria group bacterium CG1_02_40_82]|uniref:DUF5667 domain-containing protein n=4 Tax=Candidatus Portnoyibacteriota TaxID=1817913 RepID=A0A2M7IHR0_9BACT|nr:MAG: hypothetical protein AUJ32_03120 [Parcubacteria group bacterium CG1_02_40_82]PIQ75443.1 MAG: hypothetical protein COV84_01250 [Candidatus Portnoybacteria bacterium CG11_big_fil_rev_8_21_14_0_20_40_15]PIS30052.1 MAG: hypothetical protein COT41_03825 [Candidatus Portnoybacteria bacterium CG08_land_8_20_14_0_20_40_83]PIW76029.1 MAG: hypothetical protein CO001_03525 [Candidatus Portnoybacteria bacterium CG_4_8_14_3_um_filter_40_10]PIY75005.1 MAG: hypothetical protein COY85_01565 [Candidatus